MRLCNSFVFFRPDISILRWDEIFSDRMQERGGEEKGGRGESRKRLGTGNVL